MGALSIPLSPNRFGYFFAQGILRWVERSLRVRTCESVGRSRRTKPPRQATIDFGSLWCWICWLRFWKSSKSRCRIEQTPRGFERSDVRSSIGIVLPVEHGEHSRGLNFEILNFKLKKLLKFIQFWMNLGPQWPWKAGSWGGHSGTNTQYFWTRVAQIFVILLDESNGYSILGLVSILRKRVIDWTQTYSKGK